jgi:tetratricopeptide (TPR) repeat protein
VSSQPTNPVEVFYSYAHEDEKLRNELMKHLANLKRQGIITDWYDRDISAGTEWNDEIANHLNSASVILLLISPDFMNSDYSNDVEVKRAMERHEAGDARVIPIILRPVDWEGAPFSKLQGLPTDAKAITLWSNRDEAFLCVVKAIRGALNELANESPNGRSPAKIPRPPVVGFVSRRDRNGRDIRERLKEELAPHKNQLIALWGPGGSGKTTLAAEAARAVIASHKVRIAWVSSLLRADLTFLTLLDEIADQLGRPELRTLAPEEKENQVSVLIAAAPTLIVLDNFETIKSEEEQTKCVAYLAQNASCSALITTRTRIDEAFNIPLAAMSMEEAREFMRRLIDQTRSPSKFNKQDLDDLIQKCEANPLVLQWVVRQIDLALPPTTVLAYLAQGEGDAAERVFTRSFELPQLGADGRAVLLALSLFVPSASREALGKVAGLGADLNGLNQAVEHLASLWLVATAEDGERLVIQGLTQELAKVRLSKDDHAEEYRRRFVAYFLNYARAHSQPTPADYDALEAERDNVFSAMDIAFTLNDSESVMRLMDVIGLDGVNGYLTIRGYWDEAVRRGEHAQQAARALSDEIQFARFSHNLAMIYQDRGDLAKARRLYNESMEINKKLGDESRIAISLHQLAMLTADLGELDEASRLYSESLDIEKKLGNQGGIAGSLHQLAVLAQAQGEVDKARRLYGESLEIVKRLGNEVGIAASLHQLASLARLEGELDEARRLYYASLEISKRIGNQGAIASTLHQLALLAQVHGELPEARRLLNESLEINKRLGHQSNIASSTSQLGIIHRLLGERAESKAKHEESLAIRLKISDHPGIALDLHELGRLAEDEGNNQEAAQLFGEALAIFEKLKSPNAEIARESLERVKGKSS